jgi:hypothetical protein
MTTLLQARQLMQQGNYAAAREVVNTILRADPYNAEGWQLAMDLAPDANTRSQAQVGLERSIAARQQAQPMPYAQPQYYQQQYMPPQQPMIINQPGQMYAQQPYRYEKDYMGEALITLLLYYIGAGIVGFIANLIFLNNAKNDQQRGVATRNVGCLQALLAVNVIVFGAGCLALGFFFLLPLMFGSY